MTVPSFIKTQALSCVTLTANRQIQNTFLTRTYYKTIKKKMRIITPITVGHVSLAPPLLDTVTVSG